MFDQYGVGIETKNIVFNKGKSSDIRSYIPAFYNESIGSAVLNSLIIGNTNSSQNFAITTTGLVVAWDRGQLIKNVTFINFPDADSHAIRGPEIIGTCT